MSEIDPPDSMRTIRDIIEMKAMEYGEDTYLRYKDRELSYTELDEQTNRIANEFVARGVHRGDHVCLFMYNSPEYVLAHFALAKIGAVAVPVDTRFTGETLSFVLSETEADTILLDSKTREEYEAVRDDVPGITTEYFVGEDGTHHFYCGFDALRDGDPTPPDVSLGGADTASTIFVQKYTTERPKGVMLPHYSYVCTGWEVSNNLFNYSPSDHVFTNLPLHSIFTLQAGAMGALAAGAQFIIEDPFDPDVFWDQVNTYDATILLYLGRTLSVLYNRERDAKNVDNSLEKAVGHGYGFSFTRDEDLIREFEETFDITVFEGYGATETGSIATFNSTRDRKIGSSGKAVSYATVAVVDDNDRLVDPGETGEIVVRPTRPNTMLQGYYGNPEATVETCQNQWIHTGGIGYIDEDGFLQFVANQANSIYRGQIVGRISSLEIESVINAHPEVEESVVLGIENSAGKEEIKTVVVPETGHDLDPVEIYRHCEKQLARVKTPRYIAIRDELPRTSVGKVDKTELRDVESLRVWDRKSGYELTR